MITLAADCLMFELESGESVPFSAEMISVEFEGGPGHWLDAEFVRHAAKAVFHYFREELGRHSVTMGEFAGALEKALRGLGNGGRDASQATTDTGMAESDLTRLAHESGQGCELFFFPRLRDELRQQLLQNPRLVRFHGLRGCVKHLVGAQRWTPRCRTLEEQIVAFLREGLSAEPQPSGFSMVVE
jgi:hypothetical protein